MKKHFTILALMAVFVFFCNETNAQFKIHSNGQVSLGSTGTTYGLQVEPTCLTSFKSQATTPYSWSTIVYSNNSLQKHWIVANGASKTHTFYVYGDGSVYSARSYRQSDAQMQQESSEIENAGNSLCQISGVWYIPVNSNDELIKQQNKRIGVIAQEVEKVIPEAVSADENGLLFVDYDALTAFLIQAFKEQQEEIQNLRKILENSNLNRP